MARALGFAACLVLAGVGSASAGGKTSKVTIETDPPGAKVYFGLKEDGEVCTTPCTIDAPVGETAIILEAENRRSIIDNLIVKKSSRTLRVQYKLEPAVGTLIIEGGTGATIKLDDEDNGKAPRRIEDVIAGAHHVVLEKNGKTIYDEFIEIEVGHEATVSPRAAPASDGAALAVARQAPATRASDPGRSIAVTGALDIGFRQFTYSHNQTPATQRDDKEAGQVMTGPIVEVWPAQLLDLGVLSGLALYGRYEIGVNSQAVTVSDSVTGMATATSLTTSWRSLELSLHQRWTVADVGTVEVGAGYTDDRYQFKGSAADVAMVPDATYKAVRVGGRASLLFDSFEPYVTFENRLVVSGGAMEHRYSVGTSVNGFRGSLGGELHLGHLDLRIEGGLTLYTWSFRPDITDKTQSDGGTDFIQNVTIALGYTY